MFLLLWLQTIPSQTALSGANPISRRIAELSGYVGVCAHGRTAGSQWEQTTLPAASLSSLLRSPLLPSRAQGSEAGKLWAKLHLGNHLPVYAAPVQGVCESRGATHCRSAEAGMAAHHAEGRGRAGRQKPLRTGGLQPFLMFPRHSSPCTHTKFLRGRRPNSPQNQNQAELLLYDIQEMRHASFCMQLITEHENGYTIQFWEG